MSEPLSSTGDAARALGLSPRTLAKWAQKGRVRPDLVTAGGHYRWRVERLRQQLKDEYEQRLRDAEAEGWPKATGTEPTSDDGADPGRH